MAAIITLQHSSINSNTPVRVLASNVSITGKANNESKPTGNGTQLTEVLNKSWENPQIRLQNIRILPVANTLQVTDLYTLLKIKYGGSTAAPTLTVQYGNSQLTSTTRTLVGAAGTSPIKVILDNFNMDLNTTESKDGYAPMASLNFIETL